MLRPSKSYLQEALTNNTFDMESTENALRMGLDHSFSYLYRLQRNMVDFEESHYTTRNEIDRPDFGDFYLDDNDFVCLNLPGEIVTQSFRENYRQSDYYNKEIPYDTLNEYHDTMFTRFPILFIDEKVVRHPYFEIKDDYFHVRTEETRSFLLKPTFDNKRWEYEYYDHTAWLQLVGHAYYQEVVTNASMLQLQSRTYDILRADYLSQFSFHDDESPGTYFVTAFCGHETLGTTLTDAEFDEYGNLHFYFGKEDLARIKACAEDITIRIYFYQYCHSYKSFHLKDAITYPNWYVRTMARGDSATTELITLNNGDQQYMMPIPIENLMLMKVNKDDVDSTGYTKRYHMMASDMQINYPNVYHQETGLEVGDRLRLFYFYVPAYELNYTNRYAFFKEYVETLFGLDYERAINRLYFCNNLTDATRNAAASVLLYYVQQLGIPSDTNIAYLYGNITNWLGSNLPLSLIIAQSTNISITSPPDPDTSELYEVWKDFGDEFYRIVFANYADYYYDEFDYDKKHSNIHPMEYKIEKLKSFIKDDPDIFLNYVRAQDVLPIKYTFEMNEATIANRTREMDVTGSYFSETMVEFAITSPYPDDEVSGRIFIDGIYASMSIFYHYADSEYIYVPLRYVTPGCLVEVEVLPEYIKKFPISFSLLKDKETIELPATPILYPTLQDIVIKDKETGEVIDHSEFAFSITSDEINYVDSENENVDIYYEKRTNGWVDRTHYYLEDGTYFTSDGFRKPEEDSSRQDIIRLLGAGLMVKATGNGYNNQYPILQDDHYVSYNDVFAGSSIIDRENKGLNFAHTAMLTIQPKTHDIYDKELVLEIHKVPEHISSVIQSTTYPNYPNKPKYCQNPLDYLRVFKNGRLMSQKRYTQMESVDDGPIIQIMEKFTLGDKVAVDTTSYNNRLIYYKKELPGFLIDLNGYIDKPFDPRFYEVYLNGRRLTDRNLKAISPYEVQLNHVHSLYNFAIFERERDWEYYYQGFDIYHTLSNFIRESFMNDDMITHMIEWKIGEPLDNDNIEEPMDWSQGASLYSIFFDIFYYMSLVPLGLANADTYQWVKSNIQRNYPEVYKTYHEKDPEGGDVLLLSPDRFCVYEEESSDPEEVLTRGWGVYMLGNNEEDMQLILKSDTMNS